MRPQPHARGDRRADSRAGPRDAERTGSGPDRRRRRRGTGPPARAPYDRLNSTAAANYMPVRGQPGHRRWRDLGRFRFPDLHITADHNGQDIRMQK
ncbi:hypothetical protein DMH15_34915 [Streptomyces sp. WAC 06725]|nr:hypothetical protein DMH15_34915 [Streptomyces sp. WAC 06725]